MHSRSNSSAEATIKRVQGPQVDLPWGHIPESSKGTESKSKSSSETSFSASFAERRLSVLGALRVTMRLHGPEQETETPQFTVKVAALLVTVPALLLTTTSNVAPLSELVVAGVT